MRFANLLKATRLERGMSLRSLVKAGGQQWTKDQLKQIEDGLLSLEELIVESVSLAYGADLAAILPSRLAVDIAAGGVISAGGVKAVFVPYNETSLLTAYLRLIRTMRRKPKSPMITLRRDDIDVLAAHLAIPGETVVDRLTALMGATMQQRTAIASMFAMGVVVIGLAGATVAGAPERVPGIVTGGDPNPAVVVEVVSSTDSVVAAADTTQASAPPSTTESTSAPATDTAAVVTSSTAATPSSSVPTQTASVPVASPVPAASPALVAVVDPVFVAVAEPVVPQEATVTPSTAETNAGDPPLVPTATSTPTTVSEPIVATGQPPVPPTAVVDPGSAEPPTVPDDAVATGDPPVVPGG